MEMESATLMAKVTEEENDIEGQQLEGELKRTTPEPGDVPCYMHTLRYLIGILLFPITIFAMWRTVPPKTALIITVWGKLWQVITDPGLHVIVPFGCDFYPVSLRQLTMELDKSTVADLNGNPVVVGAVVTYFVSDPIKAVFNVEDVHHFLRTQALAVLKSVISQYPYETTDSQPSLKSCSGTISNELAKILRGRAELAGAAVTKYCLSDLYYAPEIASAMLMRQQAQATVDARHLIVRGAVDIVGGALQGLSQRGVRVSEEEATRLASNLLCVLCSESHVTNTLPLQ